MAANQNRQIAQAGQDQEGKEQVVRRDEFGELINGDASNVAAQQLGNINNNQEQSGNNTVPAGNMGNMAPIQGQENLAANQGTHVNDGRYDGQGNIGIDSSFRGRGGFSVGRGRGGWNNNRGGNSGGGGYDGRRGWDNNRGGSSGVGGYGRTWPPHLEFNVGPYDDPRSRKWVWVRPSMI